MLPMSRFLFFHGLDISLPPAKVLLFPAIRKFFMLFAQVFDAKNTKAALESLQLKYGFFMSIPLESSGTTGNPLE